MRPIDTSVAPSISEAVKTSETPLLRLEHVSKTFGGAPGWLQRLSHVVRKDSRAAAGSQVRAVDDVSMTVMRGEVVGLVGESGCGKSTLGRMAVGVLPPTAGQRYWNETPLAPAARRLPDGRLAGIQLIFQDASAALNPRMTVRELLGEAAIVHGHTTARECDDYVCTLLQQVGLDRFALGRYAHQFSGGQRARLGIARALALQPECLVCDESVAALDVSIQAQVLNLFMALREKLGLTYLFISHDLGVVRHVSDRVMVMYLGRVVESATAQELFRRPNHPYTQGLLASAPALTFGKVQFAAVKGEIPSPLAPPSGCHFHPRCPHAMPRCMIEAPLLKGIAPGHLSACHLNDMTS